LNRVANYFFFLKTNSMITLEKILTELKAESLNEIVAGKPGNGKAGGGISVPSVPSVPSVSEPSLPSVSDSMDV
jgi:hypothetical protein